MILLNLTLRKPFRAHKAKNKFAGLQKLYPNYANPRMAEGGTGLNDILQCSLKPIDVKAYAHLLSLAQLSRLKAAFLRSVCNYQKPGVDQRMAKATRNRY